MAFPKPTDPYYAILGNINTYFLQNGLFLKSYEKGQVVPPITRVTDFTAGILAAWSSWIGHLSNSQRQLFRIRGKDSSPCEPPEAHTKTEYLNTDPDPPPGRQIQSVCRPHFKTNSEQSAEQRH